MPSSPSFRCCSDHIVFDQVQRKVIIAIENQEPAIFAEGFIKATLACSFILLLVTIVLFKALDKRTLELSKSKSALEVALEQQKIFIFSFSDDLRNPINSLL